MNLGPKLKNTATVFNTAQEAFDVANELQSNDEDWTYKVDIDPKGSGRAIVKIYDEDGEYVESY